MSKERLPETKEITIKLELDEAKESLEHLPPSLKGLRDKIREAI